MTRTDPPTAIGPQGYVSWRAASLGAITEALEQRQVADMMGELSGRRVLDAGCGDDALVRAMTLRGADVTGIDTDPAMLAVARSRTADAGLHAIFMEGPVERLPFANASFDAVVSVTVLCFVADAAGAVREMTRVLRPGGHLVLGELGRWNIWAMRRRVRGWFGSATWKAARFRTASELRGLAEGAGLSVTAIRGAVYYPPVGFLARLLAPIDSRLGRVTTFGAAFIALSAVRIDEHRKG